MKLFVIFGQRKEDYVGQYAPEAVACATEFDYAENPEYLDSELRKARDSEEFESVQFITLKISTDRLMSILRPGSVPIAAIIEEKPIQE